MSPTLSPNSTVIESLTTSLPSYATVNNITETKNVTQTGFPSTKTSSTTEAFNGTCGKPTLNVYSASLDWWYTSTLYYAVSTFSIQYNSNDTRTGWTLLPATTPFDITAALSYDSCTSTVVPQTSYSYSQYAYSCFPAPTPVAAATSVITQTAYRVLNDTTGTGNIPNAIVTPPPPSITIGNFPSTFSEGTPVVYFSTYEIVRKSETTYENGSVGCAASTQEYPMATPFGFAYAGPNPDGSSLVGAGVTGDVNPALLGLVGQTSAIAGSWIAKPTVVVVLQEVYAARAVLAMSVPGSTLETPTPTLPPFLSAITPPPGQKPPATNTKGVVETTASFLLVPSQTPPPAPKQTQKPPVHPGQTTPVKTGAGGKPQTTNRPPGGAKTTIVQFVGRSKSKVVTLNVPVNPTQTVVTAAFGGHGIVTATKALPTKGSPGVFASLVSAILGQKTKAGPKPTPTNALQVLTQAAKTFPHPVLPTIIAPSPDSVVFTQANHGAKQTVPIVQIGGTSFVADSSTRFRVGPSATLTPGGTAVFRGTTLSFLPGGTAVIFHGRTQPVVMATITPPPMVIVAGHSYTAGQGSSYVIEGHTLTLGGVITADGDKTISLMPAGSAIVVNGQTQELSEPAITPAPVIVIDGHSYPATGGSSYVVDGQTLTPGGTITADGTTIYLGPGASTMVIDGVTTTNRPAFGYGTSTAAALPIISIGSETFTATSGSTYVINGETLTPGQPETVTMHGTTYIVSIEPSGTVVVIETEGPNGQVTATTYETITAAAEPGASITSSASGSSMSPSAAVASQNGAAQTAVQVSSVLIAFASLTLAMWL